MRKIADFVPLGIDPKQEFKWCFRGIIVSFIVSMLFFIQYAGAYKLMFEYVGGEKVLKSGVYMENFGELIGGVFCGFFITALCFLPLIAYHYMYHWQGSKSIYVMRRLPDRFELHRRCITVPLLCAAACLAAAFAVLLLYYLIYMILTPKVCIVPGQWRRIWT